MSAKSRAGGCATSAERLTSRILRILKQILTEFAGGPGDNAHPPLENRIMRLAIRFLCAAIAATLSLVPGASSAGDLVIHAGVLLDGITAQPQPRMSIIMH